MLNMKEMFEKDMLKHKKDVKDTSSKNYYFKVLTKLAPGFGVSFQSIKYAFDEDDYTDDKVRDAILENYGESPLTSLYATKHELTLDTILRGAFFHSKVFELFRKCMDDYGHDFPYIAFNIKRMREVVLCRDAGFTATGKARILIPTPGVTDNLVLLTFNTFLQEFGTHED